MNTSRSNAQMSVINTFREIWRQYIFWMINNINYIICGFGNESYIAQRVNEALNTFVVEFQKYYQYGDTKIFEVFLRTYLVYATGLLNAMKSGDTQLINEARTEGFKNADKLAAFYAGINPYWSEQEWKNLIYEHIDLIEKRFQSYFNSCTTQIIYDKNFNDHLTRISDYMAEGIIKQFNIR
ncbi:MAG: hypothetical protein ACYCWE_00750 [Eubacteriales bacterium]